jgi:NAD(P)H dehydrogenase (quinone)
MVSIAVVYHSGYGHTKAVAESVARGAGRVPGAKVVLVPVEEAEARLSELDAADAMIFGSPTYMGGVSAKFRSFAELTSKKWMAQAWKDKIAAGFTNSASQSGDKLATLNSLQVFAAQHGMVWVGLDLLPGNNTSTASVNDLNRLGSFTGLMTQANGDQGADVAPPDADHRTAEHFGQRIAEATARWVRGATELAKAA